MARSPIGRQGVTGQLSDDDGQGGGANRRPARRGRQPEQGRRGEEVEQQRNRQPGPPVRASATTATMRPAATTIRAASRLTVAITVA